MPIMSDSRIMTHMVDIYSFLPPRFIEILLHLLVLSPVTRVFARGMLALHAVGWFSRVRDSMGWLAAQPFVRFPAAVVCMPLIAKMS